MDKVLVIGGGGREHALAEKLKEDETVEEVFCAPGNGGTELAEGITNFSYEGFEDLAGEIKYREIDFVVVGPEKPLADGMANYLTTEGVPVFGFGKDMARLEASKSYADRFKEKYGVASPGFGTFKSVEDARQYVEERFAGERTTRLWVKADELCGGKGVIGVDNPEEGVEALTALLQEKKCGVGEKVIIQDHVPGEEITVQAITDGDSFVMTPSSQDHKPLYEGGTGPNTGGMGAYAPAPAFDGEVESAFREKILRPTGLGLESEGLSGPGVVYFGLGLSENKKPRVLEYNVRFGDPEAQAVLRLLDSGLYQLLKGAAEGRLSDVEKEVSWGTGTAICVVLSVKGYPVDYGTEEYPIEGIDRAESSPGIKVYHSGTRVKDGVTYTSGGRILSLTAVGESLEDARKKAYRAAERIDFQDIYYRTDIGEKGLIDRRE